MLEILSSLWSFITRQKVITDTTAFQIVHYLLGFLLIGLSAVSQLRQFSGSYLGCITTDENIKDKIDTLCQTVGTYTYPTDDPETVNISAYDDFFLRINKGTFPIKAELYPGSRPKGLADDKRIYHRGYTFVPFYLFFWGLVNKLALIYSNRKESNLMVHLIQELNQPEPDDKKEEKKIEASARHFFGSRKTHKSYALNYLVGHLINLFLLFVQLQFLYWILDTDYDYYALAYYINVNVPPELRPQGLARNFPLVANCDVRYFSVARSPTNSGGLCMLPLNDIYLCMFAVLWCLLCIILPVVFMALVFHLIFILFPELRRLQLRYWLKPKPNTPAYDAIKGLDFGSGFVVYMMTKNISPHVVRKILTEVNSRKDCSDDD